MCGVPGGAPGTATVAVAVSKTRVFGTARGGVTLRR